MSQEFLTIPEAAQHLKVHADTISAMGKRHDITIVRIGRARRVVGASIEAFVQRQSSENGVPKGAIAHVNH